jgi:hypothetical protein
MFNKTIFKSQFEFIKHLFLLLILQIVLQVPYNIKKCLLNELCTLEMCKERRINI